MWKREKRKEGEKEEDKVKKKEIKVQNKVKGEGSGGENKEIHYAPTKTTKLEVWRPQTKSKDGALHRGMVTGQEHLWQDLLFWINKNLFFFIDVPETVVNM